jgi:hypothetical protein
MGRNLCRYAGGATADTSECRACPQAPKGAVYKTIAITTGGGGGDGDDPCDWHCGPGYYKVGAVQAESSRPVACERGCFQPLNPSHQVTTSWFPKFGLQMQLVPLLQGSQRPTGCHVYAMRHHVRGWQVPGGLVPNGSRVGRPRVRALRRSFAGVHLRVVLAQ